MAAGGYRLSPTEAARISDAKRGGSCAAAPNSPFPARQSLVESMPAPFQQSRRGTCVASAVTAMVEYYCDRRRRLSVQYLVEVTRLEAREWASRNVAALRAGGNPDPDFADAFAGPVAQLSMLVSMNGADSPASAQFFAEFERKILTKVEEDSGSSLRRCLEALDRYGICRSEIWPYANVSSRPSVSGADAIGAFPPGAHDDARRHRVQDQIYVLRTPNNVDEVKGILCGVRGRRPMPVCAGLELFEGCDGETFAMPDVCEAADGPETLQVPKGLHEVLLAGYVDDAKAPGGGWFVFLNSWGADWGRGGYGRVSYAYFECFCREAGTILQNMVDYVGDVRPEAPSRRPWRVAAYAVAGVALAALAVCAAARLRAPGDPDASAVPAAADEDDECVVESVAEYAFAVRVACDTTEAAQKAAVLLKGARGEFTFRDAAADGASCALSGTMVVDASPGRIPKPGRLKAMLKRFLQENSDCAVRDVSVERLYGPSGDRPRDSQL